MSVRRTSSARARGLQPRRSVNGSTPDRAFHREKRGCSAALSRAARVVLLTSALVLVAGTAAACPGCPVGAQARRELWQQDFAYHLAIVIAPFLVIGAICLRLELAGRAAPVSDSGKRRPDFRGAAPLPTTEESQA